MITTICLRSLDPIYIVTSMYNGSRLPGHIVYKNGHDFLVIRYMNVQIKYVQVTHRHTIPQAEKNRLQYEIIPIQQCTYKLIKCV